MRDVLTRADVEFVTMLEPQVPQLDEPRAAGLAEILDSLAGDGQFVRQVGATSN